MDRSWLEVPCPLLLHFVLMRLVIMLMMLRMMQMLMMKKLKISSLVQQRVFSGPLSTAVQKQDINQLKWQAMKLVEIG